MLGSRKKTRIPHFTKNIVNRHREESKGSPPSKPRPEIGRILNTIAPPVSSGVPTKETTMSLKRKHCILHNMPGHDISECRPFESVAVREREEWIFQERLCYRCVSPNHTARGCIRRVSSAVSVELSNTQTSYTWAGKKINGKHPKKENHPHAWRIQKSQKAWVPNALRYAKTVQMDSHAAKSYWLASTTKTVMTTRYITRGAKSPMQTCKTSVTGTWVVMELWQAWSVRAWRARSYEAHVGSTDGRSAATDQKSASLYQRRHWRVWTKGGADKEDNRRSSKLKALGSSITMHGQWSKVDDALAEMDKESVAN